MPASMPIGTGDKRVEVTDQDNDVTLTDAGSAGNWETILDLSPSTDIYYWLLSDGHPQLGSQGNLRLRLALDQTGSTDISDNARIRVIGQGPEQEDVQQLGREWRYRRFSQADQYDEDDVVRLQLNESVKVTEAGHLKIQLDNSTAGNDVDWAESGTWATLEAYRGTNR